MDSSGQHPPTDARLHFCATVSLGVLVCQRTPQEFRSPRIASTQPSAMGNKSSSNSKTNKKGKNIYSISFAFPLVDGHFQDALLV